MRCSRPIRATLWLKRWSSSFGGYIAKYMGDGVLAYFGYPQAHEHDAEQAVRAGLALIDPCQPVGEGYHRGCASGSASPRA